MDPKLGDGPKNRDLALALPALRRARKRAEEIARATNTELVDMVDGKIVYVRPGEPSNEDTRVRSPSGPPAGE